MEKPKALIADDDESILWVLEKFFKDKRIEAIRAADGVSAGRLLGAPGLKLAVIDINMPGKDGLQVLREAKEAGVDTPVIIMTAESTMKNTIEAMKLGAFDYITKPFDLGELDILVERAMEDRALREKVSNLTRRLKERLADETVFIG